MPIRARGIFLVLAASAPVGVATLCHAQAKVEFRVVERTGQSVVSPTDQVLNFAVQGRVLGGGSGIGLGGFAFALIFNGESSTNGVIAMDRITNSDGTYFPGIAFGGSSSTVGVARQFGYLVGVSSIFNGLINANGGGWTQTPSQDIGLISGYAAESYLLTTPGVDTDNDGVPDTAVGPDAKLPPDIMSQYFGANGNWVDMYRFRYIVTTFSPRVLDLHLVSTSSDPYPAAYLFSGLQATSGSWGIDSTLISVPPDDVQGLRVQVVPAPGAVGGVMLIGGMLGLGSRRRR